MAETAIPAIDRWHPPAGPEHAGDGGHRPHMDHRDRRCGGDDNPGEEIGHDDGIDGWGRLQDEERTTDDECGCDGERNSFLWAEPNALYGRGTLSRTGLPLERGVGLPKSVVIRAVCIIDHQHVDHRDLPQPHRRACGTPRRERFLVPRALRSGDPPRISEDRSGHRTELISGYAVAVAMAAVPPGPARVPRALRAYRGRDRGRTTQDLDFGAPATVNGAGDRASRIVIGRLSDILPVDSPPHPSPPPDPCLLRRQDEGKKESFTIQPMKYRYTGDEVRRKPSTG